MTPDPTQWAPLLQYGALGLCVLHLAALVAVLWRGFCALDKVAKALGTLAGEQRKTSAAVADAVKTSDDLRDRILAWQCPFRGAQGAGK